MSSGTTLIAKQVRYQQWAEDIRACNDRPKGMTVDEWCKTQGIKPNTYYWRHAAVRRFCIESISPPAESPEQAACAPINFVEINPPAPQNLDNHTTPVTIRIGNATVEISETVSDAFLLRVMEAAKHAE